MGHSPSLSFLCHPLISFLFSRKQEVVGAVAKAGGVQHLISMATSEHVIMQNEALVALAIASAVDIGTFVKLKLCVCDRHMPAHTHNLCMFDWFPLDLKVEDKEQR